MSFSGTSLPQPIPGPDYELIRGIGYYKLHTSPNSWHSARVQCHQEGSHLAIINSFLEFSILKMLFDRNPNITNDSRNPYAFVGVSDLQAPKNFVTIFGR